MLLEVITGYGWLLGYFVACLAIVLPLRRFVAMPTELFRKILHLVALCSVFILIYGPMTWASAAIVACAFAVTVFPVLAFAERIPGFSRMLTERKRGELKSSLVTISVMFAVLICVCWGWLGKKYLVIASVLAWGVGDAAAALIGKRFGRHFIMGRLVEGRKSLEGTLAMFGTSFVAVLSVLLANRALIWYGYAPVAALTAAVCAVVELYTRNGMDTITCPLAAAAILIPLIHIPL